VADETQSRNRIHKRSIHSEVFITVEDDAMKLEARFVVFACKLALGTHMLNQEFHGRIWGGRGYVCTRRRWMPIESAAA
jgi:hypothetical protein